MYDKCQYIAKALKTRMEWGRRELKLEVKIKTPGSIYGKMNRENSGSNTQNVN
jgi:hypothetical protein